MLVVSPTSGIRRNDRVLVRQRDGEMVIGIMERRTGHKINLVPMNPADAKLELTTRDIAWLMRIVWVSQ